MSGAPSRSTHPTPPQDRKRPDRLPSDRPGKGRARLPRVVKQPPQIVGEIRRRRVPILDPLRQGFQADAIELRRDGRDELAQRLRFVLLDLPHQLAPIERAERTRPQSS